MKEGIDMEAMGAVPADRGLRPAQGKDAMGPGEERKLSLHQNMRSLNLLL